MENNKEDNIEISIEDLDRIIIKENSKKVKIVLSNGRRILIDYNKIQYID